ncbi:LuxR C-terminal-related transcriptional regulator [uncultured Devosia sp.]|uniref:helix-turn-helix transcriptional regulator n=1 Tax=uncultured Devosia sp. TaxID=211434 RepID=UPI0035CA7D33
MLTFGNAGAGATLRLASQCGWQSIGEAERHALGLIQPHLSRALEISRLIDAATTTNAALMSGLDATPRGVVLVDAALRILHANRAATDMLHRGDAIRNLGGRLDLVASQPSRQLAEAVARIGPGHPRVSLSASRADGSGFAVHVVPLDSRIGRAGVASTGVAAVFVGDAGFLPQTVSQAVVAIYGLTQAEGRIYERVVAGRSNREIAGDLGIATSTIRTHLVRIFDKVGRHRRADLVRLAMELKV